MCVLCVVGMCVWLRKIKTKNGENSSSSKFSFQVVVVKNYASSVRCVCVVTFIKFVLASTGKIWHSTKLLFCVSALYVSAR